MKVELSDPTLAQDLVAFLRRAECEVEPNGGGTLRVTMAASLPERAARLELEAYLQTWQALHPGVRARRRAAYDL
jgi:hypothetical protein